MEFYCDTKDLAVISKKTKRTIAKFKKGKFKTDDPRLIEKMKLHFKNDGIDYKTLNYYELRKLASKKMDTRKMKKADLIEALERSEYK